MKISVLLKIAVAVVVVAYAALCAQAADSEVSPDVGKALLAEDWNKVADLLIKVDAESPSPVLRLLKGHACLALNRNNDSVGLFLSVSDTTELNAWHTWATAFKTSHPGESIADYYVGDSMARLGKYEGAIEALQVGLRVNQNQPLLLNAQGVCYAKSGKLADARKCLEAAKTASDKLADVQANLGWYWIERSEGAEAAIEHFDSAISRSRNFALALLGRAEVKTVAGNSTSGKDFQDAALQGDVFKALVSSSLVEYGFRRAGASEEETAAELASLGTTFKREYKQDELVRSATYWGAVADTFRKDNSLGPIGRAIGNFAGNRMVERFTAINETYGGRALNDAVNHNDITRRVGPAEISRVGSYNSNIRGTERAVADVSGLGSIASGAIALRSPTPPQVKAGAGIASVALKGTEWSAKKAYDWSSQHNNTFKALDIQSVRSVNTVSRDVGGADLSLKKINWDEGDWPFKPLYGLAYGVVFKPVAASNEAEGTQKPNTK